MKKILMIATGGTIASKGTADGLVPELTSQDILHYIPSLKDICEVETLQLCNLDSTNISMEHWMMMANAIEEKYEKYDGFVICHGTDTMAYTASALSYLVQHSPKPIVLTGSQKPVDMEITDARANLLDSFIYASSDDACGVQIVFSGKVILGTRARKVRTKSFQAFTSINYPSLAVIQDGRKIQYIHQVKAATAEFYHKMDPKVGLLKLIPGIDGDYLRYFLERNDAIIIESFGVGGLPMGERYHFGEAIEWGINQGKTIVMTTQVPNEGSDMTIYQVGHHLKQYDSVLEAYDMTTEAVVTKLMWILGQTREPAGIRRLFYTTVAQDILYNESR